MSLVKQVGLKEIAYALNVSTNTVSRALRDCDDISEETKQKVRIKAIEMGYSPNNVEEYVKKGMKRNIAFVGNGFVNQYYMVMCNELISFLDTEKYDFNVVISKNEYLNSNDMKRCILQRIDGIITFMEPTPEACEIAKLYGLPVMLIGRHISNNSIDQIYTDDYLGGQLAGQYLIETLGCKRLTYLTFENVECSSRRYYGFLSISQKYNLPVDLIYVKDKNNIDVDDLISKQYDGIFCFSDELAYLLLYKASCNEEKDENFKNVHLVGYDALAHRIRGLKRITSINSNYHDIAKYAIETMCKHLSCPKDEIEYEEKCFPVKLYRRH